MKHIIASLIALLAAPLAVLYPAADAIEAKPGIVINAPGVERISIKTLLADMTDLERLTEFPSPAYTCKQFSSYDRASTTPDDPKTWFANGDAGNFLRVEERDGRKEYVMMDVEGPGAIVRIWSANPKGVLRIYLDGAEEPALAAPMAGLLGGVFPHLPPPIAGEHSKGFDLYMPVPYAKHCKVTTEMPTYYHVNYRTYAEGTPVVTFKIEQLAELEAELKWVAGRLKGPEEAVELPTGGQRKTFDISIVPGGQSAFDLFEGERALRLMRLRFKPTGDRDEPALRACVLNMTFDGETTVEAPLGDFFGSAPGINPLTTLPLSVARDGTMECRWVMPFRRKAAFGIQNHGKTSVAFQLEAMAVPRRWTDRSLLFHAKWRIQHDLPTEPKSDWNYLTAHGRGVFVGVSFNIDNPVPVWWGEGDEKIYVDGENFPSHFGTGTEDYFGYAWGSTNLFTHAYISQSRCDGPASSGRVSVNRFHILDRIPFTRAFRFDMEMWHWAKCYVNTSVLAWWYAVPGATDAFAAIRTDDVLLHPIPSYRPVKVAGVTEGESLRVIEGSSEVVVKKSFLDSDGRHLSWGAKEPGDKLLLGFNVARPGTYRVFGRFLKECGIVQATVNGSKAGTPINLNKGGPLHTQELDLGTFELKQGENEFGITITGAIPKAMKAYMIGLDYLLLKPVSYSCMLALTGSSTAAAVEPSKLICILPLFEEALRGKLSETQLQAEMLKLREQVGENRGAVRVGFSGIFSEPKALRALCRLAKQNNLSVAPIIAVQTHAQGAHFIQAKDDLRRLQWRLNGKPLRKMEIIAKNGSIEFPERDWNLPTPSRYCASFQAAALGKVRSQAEEIRKVMDEFPGVIVVVNAAIEEELASGGGYDDGQLADYSPFAIAEFRDWLRHTGKYDDESGEYRGQGAPEAIVGPFVVGGQCRSIPFHDDPSPDQSNGKRPSFNQHFGTKFTTWTLRSWDLDRFNKPITDPSFNPSPSENEQGFTAGGFDAPRTRNISDPFWNAWSWDVLDHGGEYPPGNPDHPAFGFRQVEVKHFVGDVLDAAQKSGIPKAMLYAHQIPGEVLSSPARLRSGATPIWTGWSEVNNTLGITRFGPIDPAKLTQYCKNWGIFEWHPAPRLKPDAERLYDRAFTDVSLYFRSGAHVLFPGWWKAEGKHDPIFPLNDSKFAEALKKFIASQP